MKAGILRLLFPLVDALLILLCFNAELMLAGKGYMPVLAGDVGLTPRFSLFLFTTLFWLVSAWQEKLFRVQLQDPWDVWFASIRSISMPLLLLAIALVTGLPFASQKLTGLSMPDWSSLLIAGLALLLVLPLWRVLLQIWVVNQLARSRDGVLVGNSAGLKALLAGPKGKRLVASMGIRALIVTDDAAGEWALPVLGGLDALESRIEQTNRLLLCATHMRRQQLTELIHRIAGKAGSVYVLPDLAVLDIAEVEIGRVGSQDVLNFNQGLRSPWNAFLKRSLDIVGSLAGLILLSPLLLLVALLIRLDSPGPVIYRHRRFGRGMKHIHLNKFRTMVINGDEVLEKLLAKDEEARREWEELCKLKNDPRITRIGKVLRKISIDEMPQILNVLKGEMSLVGPRPISELEYDKYGVWQENFMSVRPGLTGLWQVSGRSDLDFEDRVKLDMYYIRNWSIWMDLRIILKTLTVLVSNEGAY